jgi:predicted metal-dependent hydrolase
MLRRFFSSAPPENAGERLEIALRHGLQPVVIRRSAKAQRYTLRVRPATHELVVTMPVRGSMVAAKAFVERHRGWIETRLQRLPAIVPFAHGALIPLRGALHRICHRPGARGTVAVEDGEAGSAVIVVCGDEAHLDRRLRDFLKRQAKMDLEAATRRYASALGVSIKRIQIKDTVSRWGSCSSQGSMSYSWRIVMAPPFVLDYLAAHEVAHRVQMNHSASYWKIVRSICAHTDAAELWLKEHGSRLHQFGGRGVIRQ